MELPTEGKVNYCKHSVFELSRAINPETPPQKAVEVFVGGFLVQHQGERHRAQTGLIRCVTETPHWWKHWLQWADCKYDLRFGKEKKNPKTFPQVSKSIEIFLPDLPQPHCTDDEEICWIVLSNSEHRCGLVLLTRYSGERLFIS